MAGSLTCTKGIRTGGERLLAPVHHWLHRGILVTLGNPRARRSVEATRHCFLDHLNAWDGALLWNLARGAESQNVNFRHSHRLGNEWRDSGCVVVDEMASTQYVR